MGAVIVGYECHELSDASNDQKRNLQWGSRRCHCWLSDPVVGQTNSHVWGDVSLFFFLLDRLSIVTPLLLVLPVRLWASWPYPEKLGSSSPCLLLFCSFSTWLFHSLQQVWMGNIIDGINLCDKFLIHVVKLMLLLSNFQVWRSTLFLSI